MRWTLSQFGVERMGELASTFQFELALEQDADGGNEILRGDGLLLKDGRIRFNREQSLRGFAREIGEDEQDFLGELSREIASHVESGEPKALVAMA